MYNEIKDNLLEEDYYNEVLEGILDIVCSGENVNEVKEGINILLEPWLRELNTYKTMISKNVRKKLIL